MVCLGLLAYQGLIAKNLESGSITSCVLIIAGAVLGMAKAKNRRPVANKKALYQKSYGEFIQNAFSDDPKLEAKFYKAVDNYNRNRPAAGVDKLKKLRKECQRTADIYAVTVFTALCLDDMGSFEEALKHYQDAARIRQNTTLYSNAGLCYMRLGRFEEAEEAYQNAIRCDEKNAFAWNNLATLYFKQGEYYDALEFAEKAILVNAQMPQALSCAAICCALLDDEEEYRKYFRMAVSAGYDGNKIKNAVAALQVEA